MKMIYLIVLALVAFVVTSCKKENETQYKQGQSYKFICECDQEFDGYSYETYYYNAETGEYSQEGDDFSVKKSGADITGELDNNDFYYFTFTVTRNYAQGSDNNLDCTGKFYVNDELIYEKDTSSNNPNSTNNLTFRVDR